MLVLLDQSTPVPLRSFLKGHQVETAYERGWDTLTNGELVRMAEDVGFQVPDQAATQKWIYRPRLSC